ncbi:hypothetical protein ES705_31935 [subsurface metagenome]
METFLPFFGYLINFIYIDNSLFRSSNAVAGILNEFKQYIFHILTNVTCLGKGCCVGYGKGHFEFLGQGTGKKGFAGTGGTDDQHIGFFNFHITF